MTRLFSHLLGLVLTLTVVVPAHAERSNLNDGWRFFRGDLPGAEASGFDDRAWRQVSVPHDWSIEDLPGQTNPLSKDAIGGSSQGYMTGGIGWYRREINLPADIASKTILLRFEAVYMGSEIWVNGRKLLRHPSGYSAFDIDVSDAVMPGRNVVAVKVNHVEPSSRWYSGSGIIRPVHLEVLDRLHIDPVGPAITTPSVTAGKAQVTVRTELFNQRAEPVTATLVGTILDPNGRTVRQVTSAKLIAAGGREAIDQSAALQRPALWSLGTPNLYTLVQQLRIGGVVVDERRTRFGVRSISFDATRGFLLNGKRVLLQGGNTHHDNYMLGAAGIPRADRRKVELLKSAGFNAIRNAHNPASQATLDAADELGMLVIDEAFDTWSSPKRTNDYSRFFKDNWQGDLTSLIKAGRNHPSVIMWSIGNEIRTQLVPIGRQEAKDLTALVHALDPTRPVTASVNIFMKQGNDPEPWQPYAQTLDVAGYNYHPELYGSEHRKFPNRVFYGSESHTRLAFDNWDKVETMPWVIGDFVWTAFDYLGEAGTGWLPDAPYPWHLSLAGEIDATGKLRPAAYYRRVLWKTGITPTSAWVEWPTADGSFPDGAQRGAKNQSFVQDDLIQSWTGWDVWNPVKVVVFSEDDEVELFLNGESMGRRLVSRATQYRVNYWVNPHPGEVKVLGYRAGKRHSEWTIRTTGQPTAVKLTVDRPQIDADGDDLAYVTAQLVDDKGEPVIAQKGQKPLTFKVSGPGVLAGLGNGDPVSLESFQRGTRSTYWGRVVGVIRANKTAGTVRVEVSTDGMPPVSAEIVVR